MRRENILVILIIILGITLRIYNLSGESLWLDEALSVKIACSSLIETFRIQDNTPPLYYLILHLWIKVFGASEFSVRFPSVVFGVLGIWMIYKTGELMFNRYVGILASMIMSVSRFHISFSQEARTYSLMVFLALISMFFFVRLQKSRALPEVSGYVIFSALLLYSHIYGFFILLAQNIYFLSCAFLSKKRALEIRRWILTQIAILILFLPWINMLLTRTMNPQGLACIKMPTLTSLAQTFLSYSGSKALLVIFTLFSIFAVAYGFVKKDNHHDISQKNCFSDRRNSYLLLLWIASSVLVPFIISLSYTPVYTSKYAIAASAAFYLLAAKGLSELRSKIITIIFSAIIIISSLSSLIDYYQTVQKEQWREAAHLIDQAAGPDDLLIFYEGYCQIPFDYYSARKDLDKRELRSSEANKNADKYKELLKELDRHKKSWLIVSHGKEAYSKIMREFSLQHEILFSKHYKSIDIYLFRKRI